MLELTPIWQDLSKNNFNSIDNRAKLLYTREILYLRREMTYRNNQQTKIQYFHMILPFILALFIQRAEHLVDNRFIAEMGVEALKIHSIFYILFIIGQAIGVASSASILTLWNRTECLKARADLIKKHILLTLTISSIASLVGFYYLQEILQHFQISTIANSVAETYIKFGFFNLILQSLLGLALTILIVSNQRIKSLILMGGLLAIKVAFAFLAVRVFWDNSSNPESLLLPFSIIGSAGLLLVTTVIIISIQIVLKVVSKLELISFSQIFKIWNAEMGVAAIRAAAPAIFIFQLGMITQQKNYYVLYQLALQAAYILVLPILGANQIAIRDASGEQSAASKSLIIKLTNTQWYKNYLWCALIPTEVFLFVSALIPGTIFKIFYGLEVLPEQVHFLNI